MWKVAQMAVTYLGRYGSRFIAGAKELKFASKIPGLGRLEALVAESKVGTVLSKFTGKNILAKITPNLGKTGVLYKALGAKKMAQFKKLLKNPYLSKALDVGIIGVSVYPFIKGMFGDKDVANDPEARRQIEEAQRALEIMSMSVAQADVSYSSLENLPLDTSERNLMEIMKHVMTDRALLTGHGLTESVGNLIETLSDNDRLYLLTVGNAALKILCLGTDASEMLDAYRLQNAISDQMLSVPTAGMRSLISSGAVHDAEYEAAALNYKAVISSFNEEYSQSSFQDFFDNSTDIIFDVKDMFGGNTRANWTEDDARWHVARLTAQVSCLTTDSNLNTLTSFWDNWAVDSSGNDDESAALETMLGYQAVDENWRWFQANLAQGNVPKAFRFLYD